VIYDVIYAMIYDMIRYDTMWCDVMWYMIWYVIWYIYVIYDMICCDTMWYIYIFFAACSITMWCDIWYDILYHISDIIYDMIWYDMIWYDMICPYDIWYIELQLGRYPVAVVQYTFTHKQYIEQHNRHKQYVEQHNSLVRKGADCAPSLRGIPWHLPYNCIIQYFLSEVTSSSPAALVRLLELLDQSF